MSNERFNDELLSAIIDGEAEPELVASVNADAEASTRLEQMRQAVQIVAEEPPAATAQRRSASIAAAMAAATPAPEVTSLAAARHERAETKKQARSFSTGWVAAVAAAVAFLIAIPIAIGLGGGSGATDVAADATDSTSLNVTDAAGDAADAVAETSSDDAMEDDEAMEDAGDSARAFDDDAMEDDAMEDDAMEDAVGTLSLSFEGLESLANGVHYEGWIVVDGEPISTGNFNVDADGGLVDLEGNAVTDPFDAVHAEDATAVVVSIEPANDTDPAPSNIKVLGGDVVDGEADLSIAHGAAIGTDFADASGVYVLATPTTSVEDDELSGVWFIGLDGGAVQGLDLPELNEGWVYEGWAVIDGVPVSTGRFTDPAAADDFNGFSGTDATGPNYPGEDFIINAPDGVNFPTDLRDGTIVISVEPVDDDSPAPFALKPLVSEVADGIADHEVQSLDAGPVAISGKAVLGS